MRSAKSFRGQQCHQLLADVLSSVEETNPMLRAFIRDQAKWDPDRLDDRLKKALGESEE